VGGAAYEDVQLPKDVPPVLGYAVVSDPGTGTEMSEWKIRLSVPRIAWEVVGEVVPKSQWPELKADIQLSTLTLRIGGPSALSPSRVLDLQGNELSRDQVLERLSRETPVLVSVSGRMPEAYFLQLTKPDALIVVLGPRDGAPSPQFLPAGKGSAASPVQARQSAGQPASNIESRWPELSSHPM
jgi:hypothetical protein